MVYAVTVLDVEFESDEAHLEYTSSISDVVVVLSATTQSVVFPEADANETVVCAPPGRDELSGEPYWK